LNSAFFCLSTFFTYFFTLRPPISASFRSSDASCPLLHLPFVQHRHFRMQFCTAQLSRVILEFLYVKDAFCFQISEKNVCLLLSSRRCPVIKWAFFKNYFSPECEVRHHLFRTRGCARGRRHNLVWARGRAQGRARGLAKGRAQGRFGRSCR
jgi:hypothetical protein